MSWASFHNVEKICKSHNGLSILMHSVITLPDTTSYDKYNLLYDFTSGIDIPPYIKIDKPLVVY